MRSETRFPNPLRASFARLDPAKSGAREKQATGSRLTGTPPIVISPFFRRVFDAAA
jgi:hypothetical protein